MFFPNFLSSSPFFGSFPSSHLNLSSFLIIFNQFSSFLVSFPHFWSFFPLFQFLLFFPLFLLTLSPIPFLFPNFGVLSSNFLLTFPHFAQSFFDPFSPFWVNIPQFLFIFPHFLSVSPHFLFAFPISPQFLPDSVAVPGVQSLSPIFGCFYFFPVSFVFHIEKSPPGPE